ncbi:hypothetical protein VTJ04DRAFT_5080 [Mycothermus thermophilus]|uniref:uncharacterized protein n=1 Tax=Humicola insolens TaxID=85995 RepID=UPI003744077A
MFAHSLLSKLAVSTIIFPLLNAGPTPQSSPTKPCNPEPCAGIREYSGWQPYCYQGVLYCTINGWFTREMGRCEDWCQPPPPPPVCPPPPPPHAEGCKKDPCAEIPEFGGWEPYCYKDELYCIIASGMITKRMGSCAQWCQPEPEKPEGCP